MKKQFINEVKRMQQLAGIQLNENLTEGTRYFIVIIFEGDDDELGSMKGINASTPQEFDQKLADMYGKDTLVNNIKAHPNDTYWTFYEVSSEPEMNRIVQMSKEWVTNLGSEEEKQLETISKQGKTYQDIISSFN
jgi:hypothetical protein